MANELMIPDAAEIPAYVLNPELAKQANADAAAGITTGIAPRLKMVGKQFAVVDGNGDETPIKAGGMTIVGDDAYLLTIVLRARKAIQKAWYSKAFNPNEEGAAPDCFSNDGELPDASAPSKQCDTCALCPHNAFGSGVDQSGNPTGGKACADNKILAIYIPKLGVHKLKLAPASLKNFGIYVKQLSDKGIPIGNVKTLVGFDQAATFPKLVFRFGGFVAENLLPQLVELSQSSDAEEIANDRIAATAKQLPAPKKEAKKEAKKEVKKEEPKPKVVQQEADDLGLDLGTQEPVKAEPVQAAPEEVETVEITADDSALASELGLDDL